MRILRPAANAAFLFVSLFSLLASTPALATTLHVPGEYATIQAAIDAAVVGDIVEVACGNYQVPEIIMKSGITLRSATGEADCVIVEPLSLNLDLIDCVVDASAEIEGITFRGANGNGNRGGLIYFEGSPRVSRCKFVDNSGRGIPNAALGNTALAPTDCSGWQPPIIFASSNAVVTDCEFANNWSAAGGLGACGSPLFIRCLFNGNRAEFAGGAMTTSGGSFVDCVFRNSWGSLGAGAALSSETVFISCLFEDNETGLSGGAVDATGCSFDLCTFVGNRSSYLGFQVELSGGGALRVRGNASTPTVITRSTFHGNSAEGPRQVVAGTVATSEVRGAAIFVAGGAVIENVIVSGNHGVDAIYCESASTVAVFCSNIFGNPGGDWTGCITSQLGVNGNISVDPMFCDAQNGDFTLSSLSPCLYAECGVMGALGQGCFDAKPALYSVSDVGNDQGRQVRLTWQRSAHDSPTANPYVVGYAVYRKKDQFAKEPPVAQMARGEGVAILGWDYLGTVPSRGDSIYETVVPTLCDSTIADGQCLSTFFLSAMTQNPFIYYDSPPQSGYSLDNVAPPTPTGFAVAYNTGSGNHLEWDAVAAGDFAGFRVYRAVPPGGFATSGTLVATTTQTSWTDPDFDGWNVGYEVTSFDGAGNESAPAVGGTTTDVPTATLHRLELLPNVPNPFNPSTRIPFTTPSEGPVRVAIYDTRGSLVRVLVDKSFPAGHHGAVWDGRDAKGSPVSSGIYLCRLEHRSDVRTRKIVLIK